jgi:hypothetical protein
VDEQKRFVSVFRDPHQLLGVHDLPDPDEPLSEEERELFGIVDGQHTVAEVVAAAPLSEYEAYESLHRMLESSWIAFVGRRDPGVTTPAGPIMPPPRRGPRGPAWLREAAVAGAVVAAVALASLLSASLQAKTQSDLETDVYAAARVRDLKLAVDLFARERGEYPHRLVDLADDRWIEPSELVIPGYKVSYQVHEGGSAYDLTLTPDR